MTQPTLSPVPAEKTVPADAPRISVVVPVYKVEKFVAECLESILAQDFDSFEVVVVDDGSPDASGKICDEFAARDPRLRVFHKENGGVNAARKLGVERSRGEWICFVDSDDVLLPHALSALFAATKDFPDADLVEGKSVSFFEYSELGDGANTRDPATERSREPFVADGYTFAVELDARTSAPFFTAPWRKIVRRELLIKTNALCVPREIFFGDDAMINLRLSPEIRSAVSIAKIVYGWRKNDSSITRASASRSRGHSVDYRAKLWTFTQNLFCGQDEKWQPLANLFIAKIFPAIFLGATGTFLRHPKMRPFVTVLASPDIANFSFRRKRMLRLILLGVKFPFSLVPEPIFRLAIRVILRALNFPRKVLLKLRGRR